MRRTLCGSCQTGFTIAEVMVASAAGFMILAVLISTSTTLERSMAATSHYAKAANDGSRVVDHVVQDLRRSLRVGTLESGRYTPLKSNAGVIVSGDRILTINIPDYYSSNSPSRALDSPFRSSRYARSTLNILSTFNGNGAAPLNGSIYWNEAVTKIGSVETTRFSPASLGNGEIQVRYYRAARSDSDPRVCYFRAEYNPEAAAPNFPPQEIAEPAEANGKPLTLVVEAPNLPVADSRHGKIFRVKSSFSPRFRRDAPPEADAQQYLTVVLRNGRRD